MTASRRVIRKAVGFGVCSHHHNQRMDHSRQPEYEREDQVEEEAASYPVLEADRERWQQERKDDQ